MAKGFLEVFPDLHMTTEMEELLKLVDVERVSSTRDRRKISMTWKKESGNSYFRERN